MQIINLLPDVQLAKRRSHERSTLVFTIFLLVFGAVILTSAGLFGFLITKQVEKKTILKKIDGLSAEAADINKFGVEVTDPNTGDKQVVHIESAGRLAQSQLTTIKSLLDSRQTWKKFIQILAFNTPTNVEVKSVAVSEAFQVTASVSAIDIPSAAAFVNGIKNYKGDLVSIGLQQGVLVKGLDNGIFLMVTTPEEASACQPPSTDNQSLCGASEDAVRGLLLTPAGVKLKSVLKTRLDRTLDGASPVFTGVTFTGVSSQTKDNSVEFTISFAADRSMFIGEVK